MALSDVLDVFGTESREFVVSLDVGGMPPTIPQVTRAYRSVSEDLNLAWQFAEVMRFIEYPEQEAPPHIAARIRDLESGHVDKEIERWIGVSWSDNRAHSEPEARVLESRHTNPLETIIAVAAGSTVMLIVTAMWAYRYWRRTEDESKHAAVKIQILEEIAQFVAKGDDFRAKKILPIAIAIDGIATLRDSDRLDVQVTPGFKFGIGPASQTSISRRTSSRTSRVGTSANSPSAASGTE
jgi:hypothetical protein